MNEFTWGCVKVFTVTEFLGRLKPPSTDSCICYLRPLCNKPYIAFVMKPNSRKRFAHFSISLDFKSELLLNRDALLLSIIRGRCGNEQCTFILRTSPTLELFPGAHAVKPPKGSHTALFDSLVV